MDVKTSHTPLPTLTPAQQGVFFDLLEKQTPAWLLESSDDLRSALYKTMKASYHTRRAALDELRALKSPEAFCAPILAKAMSAKLGEPFDVEGVIFQHVRSTSSLLGLRKKLVLPIERDLLTAACENFEASETKASNYHDSSLIYVPERITGQPNKVLSINPHEFAQLCRALDLGKHYQEHVKALFGDGTQAGSLGDKYVACAKDQFEVARHIALMKKHIGTDVYQMLRLVTDVTPSVKLGKNTLGFQRLEMFGVKLNGPMFIGPVSAPADEDYRCVVYIPDDPSHPLKEYASFTRCEVELSNRLKTSEYRNFFLRFIALKDRGRFLKELDARLLNPPRTPLPPKSLYAQITGVDLPSDVKTDLFSAMYRQRAAQVIADSRLLVVPTDDEDEKTRLARLETYETIGINITLFFASFVPVVGEVMFAVAGFQLLHQVYDGIDSWARGEQEQATDYFFDTLENLIVMAAVGAGAAAAGKAYKAVRASDFVQGLRTVAVADGARRLWKPDLSAYRRPLPLRPGMPFSEQGLVSRHGRRYLPVGTEGYAVHPVPDTGLWEIQSPGRYSPVLETNGAGAWRHASELPQDWNLLTLFRRLGYHQAELSDTQALQILAATGLDEKPLRQLYVDRRKPMAALIDTARRFRADGDVTRFIEQMGTPASASFADADLQLYLLSSLAKWPKNLAVSSVDILQTEVARYGSVTATRTLKISAEQLRKGQFHPAIWQALSSEERLPLFGTATADKTAQTTLLTSAIGAQAQQMRLSLFDRLIRRTDVERQENATPIRQAFRELPASVADELVEHADLGEWQELEAGRVPLRLAEEARRYVQVLRLNRAYEGLFLDAVGDHGTYLLVLDALENLPGWPKDVALEIMERAVHSDSNPGIGPKAPLHKVYIDAYADRYEATDAQDNVLAKHSGRTLRHFFQTLRECLPDHARKSLGVQVDDAGINLQQKITALALQRRDAIAQVIGIESVRAGYRSPMGLADRPLEHSALLGMSDSNVTARHSPPVIRRARELYPLHSLAQIDRFLGTLGTDKVLVLRALENLRQEYQTIRTALEHWVNRESYYQDGDGPRLKVPRQSKARAQQVILRAWRKESEATLDGAQTLHRLIFDAQPLGDMPVIVGDFSHIGLLEMNNVGSSAGLNDFLRNFTQLRVLSLTGNGLTRIPQAVAEMPHLTRLDVSDNRIYLTAEAVTALASKTDLQNLNLSFNPALGRVPTVTTLSKLRHLALRGTGIDEWPAGASELPDLQTLDLRDNAIVQIPQAIFAARSDLNLGTNVDGNPLSSSSLQAIVAYQKSHGINLGVTTAGYRPAIVRQPSRDPLGSRWITGLPVTEVNLKQTLWTSLTAYPNSGDLFYLLGQLLNTVDFIRLPGAFSQRVWNVLEAAGEDDAWRRALFQIARIGRVSAEDPARLFSNLEIRVLCFRATAASRTGTRSLEGELIHLMRGLFRLQQVEQQVLKDIATRPGSSAFTRAQVQELSLAYRVGLARRLDLPAQPREINVRLDVEVSAQQLENAYQAIIKAETPTALLASANARGFWYEYLVTAYQGQFTAISDRTTQALVLLEAQIDLPRATASRRLKAIIENDRNENQQLIQRLTTEAVARHSGLAIPGPSTRATDLPGASSDE
ncbi:hypothetical protein NTD84_13320 [Pseudomonas sp. 14P_8.1_Bac3]|uniref:dermonecrotic toxin domain-containing protein n=1 Tax=Pseudomonas sp. 14P_8.1_Bac3 TaxID=2971621 RepID=UPI0021C87B9F|nr:DUF6543 domain-containing protein [Pseudomonas sp. 14P_8.1_Bac3]MCU1760693.1 hypothetical protein [Pseudomonas sp. 14P_8.1_Bac3]